MDFPQAAHPQAAQRLALTAAFRRQCWDRTQFVPFPHQAAGILAIEGWTLTDEIVDSSYGGQSELVRLPHEDGVMNHYRDERRMVVPRKGGAARVAADLGAYKAGKSMGVAALAVGYACLSKGRVCFVGLEYKNSEHEFDYLLDWLCSRDGMGLAHRKRYNDPRGGRMYLELRNGFTVECMSWNQKENLKGDEVDLYCWNETYMFPGLEIHNTTAQNLRKRKGAAYFSSTPDRAWVQVFHDKGHGTYPEWHCTCSVSAEANPFTFDRQERDRADPDQGGHMTRERFAISWGGKLGDFAGRVYQYARGERPATRRTAPFIFRQRHAMEELGEALDAIATGHPAQPQLKDIRLPTQARVMAGADTGTFMSGAIVAILDDLAIVLEEFPNYRYIGTEIELLDVQISEWTKAFVSRITSYTGRERATAWVDTNSQFKKECGRHKLTLLGNPIKLESRTEVTRNYFQADRILFCPWLEVLPYELEWAAWPDGTSGSGKYERVKEKDHTLDCVEHVLSRRPRSGRKAAKRAETFLERYMREHNLRMPIRVADPHLGMR